MELSKIEQMDSFGAVKDFLAENFIKDLWAVKCKLTFKGPQGNHLMNARIEIEIIDHIPAYKISTNSFWTHVKKETIWTSYHLFKNDEKEKSLTTQISEEVLLIINYQL